MGNGDSAPQGYQGFAYRVVNVLSDSPAQAVGIEAQLDFIKYSPPDNNNKLFSEFLAENEGSQVCLRIYNIIQQDYRTVNINLHRKWGDGSSLLGATIRFESYEDAHINILAVNEVYLDSPSHEAGLIPHGDFILGTREISFKSLDEFAKYIQVNVGSTVKLFVYNKESEQVREVALTPRDWGGQGILGCDVSFGFFNKIPLRRVDVERISKKSSMTGLFHKLTGELRVIDSPQAPKELAKMAEEDKSGKLYNIMDFEKEDRPQEAVEEIQRESSRDKEELEKDESKEQREKENLLSKKELIGRTDESKGLNLEGKEMYKLGETKAGIKQLHQDQTQAVNLGSQKQSPELQLERQFNLLPTSLNFE